MHYAPRTPALRVDSIEDLAKISWPWPKKSALLVLGPTALPDLPAALHLVELPEPKAAGQRLYSILHECDALDLDVIIIVMPPDQPESAHHPRSPGPRGETGGGLRWSGFPSRFSGVGRKKGEMNLRRARLF